MSKHNYTLKDFKMSDAEPEVTPLDDILIHVYFKKIKNIPDRLAKRIENLMNDALSEYEKKIKQDIPLDKVDFEVTLEVDTIKDTFSIWLYMGCDITDDGIEKREYLTPDDADYQFIKGFFYTELNKYVAGQIEQIMSHID
jgi:hypothetical protein